VIERSKDRLDDQEMYVLGEIHVSLMRMEKIIITEKDDEIIIGKYKIIKMED